MWYTTKVCQIWINKVKFWTKPIILLCTSGTFFHWRNPLGKPEKKIALLYNTAENTKVSENIQQNLPSFLPSDCVNDDVNHSVKTFKQSIEEKTKNSEVDNEQKTLHGLVIQSKPHSKWGINLIVIYSLLQLNLTWWNTKISENSVILFELGRGCTFLTIWLNFL